MKKIIHNGKNLDNFYEKGSEILSYHKENKIFEVFEVEVYKIFII